MRAKENIKEILYRSLRPYIFLQSEWPLAKHITVNENWDIPGPVAMWFDWVNLRYKMDRNPLSAVSRYSYHGNTLGYSMQVWLHRVPFANV